MKIDIVFGALVDRLYKQLGLSRRVCSGVQELADSITHLKIARILTDSQAHAARRRLMKRLIVLKAGKA